MNQSRFKKFASVGLILAVGYSPVTLAQDGMPVERAIQICQRRADLTDNFRTLRVLDNKPRNEVFLRIFRILSPSNPGRAALRKAELYTNVIFIDQPRKDGQYEVERDAVKGACVDMLQFPNYEN